MPDVIITLFALGLIAGLIQSDLKISRGTYETIAILLMFAIGLKGGIALHGNWQPGLLKNFLVVGLAGALIPVALYPLLRHVVALDKPNAASIAAHYGSVSAGTFAVVVAWAEGRQMAMAPETTLYLVLLELPAIIVGILLYRIGSNRSGGYMHMIHEAFTSRGVLLLIGGVIVGYFYGKEGAASITPLFITLFPGLLAFFLLEMGLLAARELMAWKPGMLRVAVFALVMPTILATLGILLGFTLGLPEGTILVLATIVASASYIAAPAAIRQAVPEADVGLAMLASLGITFPFNVLLGIPLYAAMMKYFAGMF
jgi:hypothetical protein